MGPPPTTDTSEELSSLSTYRIGSSVPAPIRDRLDEMLGELEDYEDTDRDELLAAIILGAPESPADLGRLLENY